MTPILLARIKHPFDDMEMYLLEQIALAQDEAYKWGKRARDEYDSDTIAMHAYIEHMAALNRSRAYGNALHAYRKIKHIELQGLPPQQIAQTEELSPTE